MLIFPSKPQISVYVGTGFDIWLHSYFLTGLVALEQQQVIDLELQTRDLFGISPVGHPLLVCCLRGTSLTRPQVLCFDAQDQADRWHSQALAACDLYFKRSAHPPAIQQLAARDQAKVRPINPMFATWDGSSWNWSAQVYRSFLTTAARRFLSTRNWASTMAPLKRSSRDFATLSTLREYEDTPVANKRLQVLFQTRLWNPSEEEGDWVEPCNQHRIKMVRVLRAKLGDRVVGGLIRERYAAEQYPELLTNLTPTGKAQRPEFIRLCRQFLVRVNIKALFDAIPYSLGETLAANNCLVSESIRNISATPLIPGQHYSSFTTPEECADQCLELLDSPQRAQGLREVAHEYYRTAVQPAAAMKMYLDQALSQP